MFCCGCFLCIVSFNHILCELIIYQVVLLMNFSVYFHTFPAIVFASFSIVFSSHRAL